MQTHTHRTHTSILPLCPSTRRACTRPRIASTTSANNTTEIGGEVQKGRRTAIRGGEERTSIVRIRIYASCNTCNTRTCNTRTCTGNRSCRTWSRCVTMMLTDPGGDKSGRPCITAAPVQVTIAFAAFAAFEHSQQKLNQTDLLSLFLSLVFCFYK